MSFIAGILMQVIEKGTQYNPPNNVDEVNYYTQKSLGVDPGFGSSAFDWPIS